MEQLFNSHGVQTKWDGNNLFALDVYMTNGGKELAQWVNVTQWDESKVKIFLGY